MTTHHAAMRHTLLTAMLCGPLLTGCASPGTSIVHRKAPGALGPYSGSVENGGLIFAAGKIGERGGTFEHEVNTAIDAVEQELTRAGAGLDDVLQATVYLTDLDNYAAFNEIYGRRMGDPYPARACVEVGRLPGDARVEIQVIARRP